MTSFESPVPDPDNSDPTPTVTRDIYGMPMFPTLLVADLTATIAWYREVLGFIELFAIPGPDGIPALVHLRRWRFQDILVRQVSRPVRPATGLILSFAATYEQLDEIVERAVVHGDGSADAATDTAWNTRDVTTIDPDGNVVIFTAARPRDKADERFSSDMLQWGDHPENRRRSADGL